MSMKKIRIVLADSESSFLDRMTRYFSENGKRLEVLSFSTRESLLESLKKDKAADVLVLGESMLCDATDTYSAVKIILSEDISDTAKVGDGNYGDASVKGDYKAVKKYQKIESLYRAVRLAYGELSGQGENLLIAEHSTKLVAFYSPVGGSGKTILSLFVAHALGLQGRKVFYLNCEKIDSTCGLLAPRAKVSVSDLLDVLVEGKSIGWTLTNNLYASPTLAFSYLNPLHSAQEWNELSVAQRDKFFEELGQIGQFDYVVLDFDSDLSAEKLEILQQCDQIVMPFLSDGLRANKMAQFFREVKLRKDLAFLEEKIIYVGNHLTNLRNLNPAFREFLNRKRAFAIPYSPDVINETALQNGDSRCAKIVEFIVRSILHAEET